MSGGGSGELGGAAKLLRRHELRRADGRQLFVYGELCGALHDGEHPEAQPSLAHQRLDVFTDAWVVVSPARNERPLDRPAGRSGGQEASCPFCPGGYEVPFAYTAAVFENRFPPFRDEAAQAAMPDGPARPARGRAEIVLYTDRHDASFAQLTPAELGRVLAIWTDRSRELWSDPTHAYVSVFENRGALAGATIAHPHGQIYAVDHLPPLVAAKLAAHLAARGEGRCLSCDAVAFEARSGRVVVANASFVVAVPFAARWPYEVSVRARRHGLRRLGELEPAEQLDLLRALSELTRRYDALFNLPLPYMMVAQEAPRDEPDWHLSFEFFPLNRSAEKVKIRASSETGLGLFLNDVLPEDAAAQLARLPVTAAQLGVGDLVSVASANVEDEPTERA
jgi:UDPglucose--hexose-1-phosphate uridylyltransferase